MAREGGYGCQSIELIILNHSSVFCYSFLKEPGSWNISKNDFLASWITTGEHSFIANEILLNFFESIMNLYTVVKADIFAQIAIFPCSSNWFGTMPNLQILRLGLAQSNDPTSLEWLRQICSYISWIFLIIRKSARDVNLCSSTQNNLSKIGNDYKNWIYFFS